VILRQTFSLTDFFNTHLISTIDVSDASFKNDFAPPQVISVIAKGLRRFWRPVLADQTASRVRPASGGPR
jgi:hypothetical protein